MAFNNNDDWKLIREEMEIEASNRRFERHMRHFDTFQRLFLSMFPENKRSKVADIETLVLALPLIALFLYVIFRLIFPH